MSVIAPSLLSADFTRLDREMERVRQVGAKILHLDVMDGNFVPNITFGSDLVAALRPLGEGLTFDVHLMMLHPKQYLKQFADAGADMITVHIECLDSIPECIDMIRSYGAVPGISIKPSTPPSAVSPYLDRIGLILVMTVEPGFGAQHIISACTDKLPVLRSEIERRGCDVKLSVDGGIHPENCREVAQLGADILVAGSAVFNAEDMNSTFNEMQSLVSPF